jgi:hypothetical protein
MGGGHMRAVSTDNAAEAAHRILGAFVAGERASLEAELDRAAALCDGPWRDSDCEERAELLGVVVDAIRRELIERNSRFPPEAVAGLLRHLARLT